MFESCLVAEELAYGCSGIFAAVMITDVGVRPAGRYFGVPASNIDLESVTKNKARKIPQNKRGVFGVHVNRLDSTSWGL